MAMPRAPDHPRLRLEPSPDARDPQRKTLPARLDPSNPISRASADTQATYRAARTANTEDSAASVIRAQETTRQAVMEVTTVASDSSNMAATTAARAGARVTDSIKAPSVV